MGDGVEPGAAKHGAGTGATSVPPGGPLEQLSEKLGVTWTALAAAKAEAHSKLLALAQQLSADKVAPADGAIVVFGSLARLEWTAQSDLDWALLIDGQCDPQHQRLAAQTRKSVTDIVGKPPGPTGLFGGLVFAHDLLHYIGGNDDTNKNTSRRILLLLESRAVVGEDVRRRVIKHLLRRYVEQDGQYPLPRSHAPRPVPRFLLNDIARFWRTMAVDYAGKHAEREGRGMALRSVKLRISRKLIFAGGLASCFLSGGEAPPREDLLAQLETACERRPLDAVASLALRYGPESGRTLFEAYDAFIRLLNDAASRQQLEALTLESAQSDEVYREAREITDRFQEGLSKLFFDTDQDLTKLTQRYGVF